MVRRCNHHGHAVCHDTLCCKLDADADADADGDISRVGQACLTADSVCMILS